MLIDTHAHLTDERYNGADDIISSMKECNLEKIICVGYDLKSSKDGLELARKNKDIYAAVGVHPSEANDFGADYDLSDELILLAKDPKTVAIGEIGLDYHYDDADKINQDKLLNHQLDIVEKSGLPVIIHLRDAYEDMLKIIKANRHKLRAGGVMHCFSGSKETAMQYVDMGFYISFSGTITFKNSVKAPEIIKAVPKDRLLIETDCPYLAPHPFRGQLNEPKYVLYQALKVAEVLGISIEEAEELTRKNAYSLFTKMQK